MIGSKTPAASLTRRALFLSGAVGLAGAAAARSAARAGDDGKDAVALVKRLTGKTPVESDRLRMAIPRSFPNGYTVPLSLDIDSPMTESDHVRYIRVVAPRNPLIDVATFHFVVRRSRPRVSTRIRLAMPQFVLAFAELSDGTLLLARRWCDVATNGCA